MLFLYLIVQIVQGAFLIPRIHSHSLKVHPVLILVSIVVGSEIGGMWGVVLGPPLAASIKELFAYFSNPETLKIVAEDNSLKDMQKMNEESRDENA